MVNVPVEFQPRMPFMYPADNCLEFEFWYYTMANSDPEREDKRVYLPVMWTAYYVRNGIDKKFIDNTFAYNALQQWLNGLPTDTQYYTIVQHDDGIVHNLSHLDIKVFSTGGGKYDHAIPLLSWPHEWQFPTAKKTILASFVGQITHPVRQEIVNRYGLRNDKLMLSTKKMPLKEYCQILAISKYVLCPRGYGPTSFRIQEAVQYGAIPVYISDIFIEPYGTPFENYGVKISDVMLDSIDLPEYLSGLPYVENMHLYTDSFIYSRCKAYIQTKI